MSTITLTVSFYGGEGSVIMDGEGIPKNTTINSDQQNTAVTANQIAQDQAVILSGIIPAGDATDSGKITIAVTDENGKMLSSADDNTFEPTDDGNGNMDYTFNGFVTYEI